MRLTGIVPLVSCRIANSHGLFEGFEGDDRNRTGATFRSSRLPQKAPKCRDKVAPR